VPWRFLDAGQLSLLVAGVQKPEQIRTHAVQQITYSITSLARASNGRLMSGLRLPADAAMAYALFALGAMERALVHEAH
jgi:hypothetical protein